MSCVKERMLTLLLCQTEERSRWMAQIVRVLEDIYKVAPLPPLYISSLTGTCTRDDARAHEKMRSCCSREMHRRTSHKHGMYTHSINMACDR